MENDNTNQEVQQEENFDEFSAAFAESAEKSAYAEQSSDPTKDEEDNGREEIISGFGDNDDAAADKAADKNETAETGGDDQSELEKTKEELERLKQSERSQKGRVSALTKKLEEMRAAAEAKSGGQPSDSGTADVGDWDEFKSEFPEMAAIVEQRLSKVEEKLARSEKQVQSVADATVSVANETLTTYKEGQFKKLRQAHADLDEVMASEQFKQWKQSANGETLDKIKSLHADDAISALDDFKKQVGWAGKTPATTTDKSEVEKINERRQQRLKNSAGIASKETGHPQPPKGSDDFDSGFADTAKKKELERRRQY